MPFLGPLNGLLRLGTLVLLAGMFLASIADAALGDKYLLGAGKADITGPVVELPFHGYAMLEQKGTGLRQRIFSRAFIIGSTGSSASRDRFLYIIVDTMGGDSAIRRGIIEGVQKLGPAYAVYTDANIAVIGTHSHSGPGGWHNYLLHQFPSLGFNQQSYDAIVAGGVLSVKRAHEALAEVSQRPKHGPIHCDRKERAAGGTHPDSGPGPVFRFLPLGTLPPLPANHMLTGAGLPGCWHRRGARHQYQPFTLRLPGQPGRRTSQVPRRHGHYDDASALHARVRLEGVRCHDMVRGAWNQPVQQQHPCDRR